MPMHWYFVVFLEVLAVLVSASPAQADAPHNRRRFALVYGVNAYADSPLNNAVNDAEAMGAKLHSMEVQVFLRPNRTRDEIYEDVRSLANHVAMGDQVIVYLAGHGFSAGNARFFMPRDADLHRPTETSVNLGNIVTTLTGNGASVVLIVDACRNQLDLSGTILNYGLRPIEGTYSQDVIVISSTSDDFGAADAASSPECQGHSPFTCLLLNHIDASEPISGWFPRVTEGTIRLTSNSDRPPQRPWMLASTSENTWLRAPQPSPPEPTPTYNGGGVGSMVTQAWTASGYSVNDWVSANMTTRARQFANGFVAVTDLIRGTVHEGERRTVVASVVAGHCYRIIGVGGVGVRDLDLFLRDMGGRVIDQDRAPDNYPVIGLDRQLCIPQGMGNQPAQLEIVMFRGNGEFGVQVFGTP